jgi:hypothetical protein
MGAGELDGAVDGVAAGVRVAPWLDEGAGVGEGDAVAAGDVVGVADGISEREGEGRHVADGVGVGSDDGPHTPPLSMTPSQSSSMPLHVSTVGEPGWQRELMAPPMHVE